MNLKVLLLPALLIPFLMPGICALEIPEPKGTETLDINITQSGRLVVNGDIRSASLSLYIPQEGVKSVTVTPDTWDYRYDSFGNRIVVITWQNPMGNINYSVETNVEGRARHVFAESPIGENTAYLNETYMTIITDDIREKAYPYEKSLRGVAELTGWVNSYMTYDESLFGQIKPSDWVFENRRGVCVEYSNLLVALLRSKGIPTRYVSGYVYSDANSFIGHAWVEVLAGDSWVSFDPSWLEGGYLDATHIKTGVSLDGNHSERLIYLGRGDINWFKNPEVFNVIDYTTNNITYISSRSNRTALNAYGLIESAVSSSECQIAHITASSCIAENRGEVLDIYDNVRKPWLCGSESLYWVFELGNTQTGYEYVCPVIIYNQAGARSVEDVRLSGEEFPQDVFINGPDMVGMNDSFTLYAQVGGGYVFFSPNLTRHEARTWGLRLNKPGMYSFYLFSDGALAIKRVNVTEKKEFDLSFTNPENATIDVPFMINVTAKNMFGRTKSARIRIWFEGNQTEAGLSFSPNELKSLLYNLTTRDPGVKQITVSLLADTITSYSSTINIYTLQGTLEPQKGILESIIDAIAGFFQGIAGWFSSLFNPAGQITRSMF
jgi:hypothetical protein